MLNYFFFSPLVSTDYTNTLENMWNNILNLIDILNPQFLKLNFLKIVEYPKVIKHYFKTNQRGSQFFTRHSNHLRRACGALVWLFVSLAESGLTE